MYTIVAFVMLIMIGACLLWRLLSIVFAKVGKEATKEARKFNEDWNQQDDREDDKNE